MLKRTATFSLALVVVLPILASAQVWSDDFDSYPGGLLLDNVGGWTGWDDDPAVAGTTSNTFARSAPNSIELVNSVDAVHPFFAADCGQWVLTAWIYIPMGGLNGGQVYFLVQNQYSHGGPYEWAVQISFDGVLNQVTDDLRPGTAMPRGVIYDQWVEIRVEIDLDADTINHFYNGANISSGTYAVIFGDPLVIDNLDLYSTGGNCYFDDISLVPVAAQDGDVRLSQISSSIPAPMPMDIVDLDVEIVNESMSALAPVRVDLFIDPTLPPATDALGAMRQSLLFDGTLAVAAGPGTTATATFMGLQSPIEDIWRLYASVNSDEAVCGDDPGNNVLGPALLGWVSAAATGVCGDCDGSGAVTILDALRGSQFAAGILIPTAADILVCDVDLTSAISVLDALIMAQEAAGLMPSLNCAGGPSHLVEIFSPAPGSAIGAGVVSIFIDLWDATGSPVDTLDFQHSVDGGATFAPCTEAPASTLTRGSAASPGANQEFLWDADTDVPVRPTSNVILRVTATTGALVRAVQVSVNLN